jgi:hypothetical protein
MLVTAAWLVLISASLGWELYCRRKPARWTSLTSIASRLWEHRLGRVLLVAVWAFVGWHFFSRYTIPR